MFARSLALTAVLLSSAAIAVAAEEPLPVKSSFLQVPGAKLYYEVRGSGPLLLLIPGGPTDAGVFEGLAQRLADRYTVVAYDPRGNSRSTVDSPPEEQSVDLHADDAARLIDELGDGPAYVFGTSGGAQIGLDLAARHPQRVRILVAHEPPCILLLDDAAQVLSNNQQLYETYRRQGPDSALQRFMAMNGMTPRAQATTGPPPTMPPAAAATFGRIQRNLDYFFLHGLGPLSLYRPDIQALRASAPRIVVAVGSETVGQTAHRTGAALAAQLRIQPVVFPGDHGGYGPHAAEFAAALHAALTTARH
jgi:pimeloyl-ACP methyl ester carboxylesterase